MDSFALPVEGTETRVNAHEQAYEYMTAYMEAAGSVGITHIVSGWAMDCYVLIHTIQFSYLWVELPSLWGMRVQAERLLWHSLGNAEPKTQ